MARAPLVLFPDRMKFISTYIEKLQHMALPPSQKTALPPLYEVNIEISELPVFTLTPTPLPPNSPEYNPEYSPEYNQH